MPRIRRQYKNIHKRSDSRGNMLLVEQEPVYGTKKIYLHLKGEEFQRLVAEIDPNNRTMFLKRDRNKHFHFQMMSYGFNYSILKDTKNTDNILLQVRDGDDNEYYMLPRKFILENGVVKEFSKVGFEIQIFLRVEYLEKFKTKNRWSPSKLLPQND